MAVAAYGEQVTHLATELERVRNKARLECEAPCPGLTDREREQRLSSLKELVQVIEEAIDFIRETTRET